MASFKLQSSMSNMTSQNMNFQNNSQDRSARGNGNYQGRSMQRSMNGSSGAVLMQIAYTDTMGERKIVEKQVNVGSSNVASGDGQTAFQGRRAYVQQENIFSNYALYFIGIIAVAGIVLAHRKYRSRKLLDPGYKLKDLFKR